MAQSLTNLVATQAAVSPGGAGDGESLPSDLVTFDLEDLMNLRVGGHAKQVPENGERPVDLPADLPADLMGLSLLQLMDLPLRAPQVDQEDEPEVAEDDGGDDETVAAVDQTETGQEDGQDSGQSGGAAFSAADLDGDEEALSGDLLEGLGLESGDSLDGDDPLDGPLGKDGAPVAVAALQHLGLLISGDDAGPGSSALFGLPAAQSGAASPGIETLTGGTGNDVLNGGNGRDTLFGGAGDDTLFGGNGNDILDGGAGNDALFGGNGKDSLTWDQDDNIIDGGNGQDTLVAAGGNIDLTAYAGALTSIENIELAGDGAGTSVTLDAQDVLDISSTDILTVSGDLGDSIHAGSGWTDAGPNGSGSQVYTQMVAGNLATLVVDLDLAVNPDILL